MFKPSPHSYGADWDVASDIFQISSALVPITSALSSSGTNKLAAGQAQYQASIIAKQAAIQAEIDAKNQARTNQILLYTILTGVVVFGGLGGMYVVSKRKKVD